MSDKIASARKNGSFGYKAVINYVSGRSHIPVQKNFKKREEAVAYAQQWIDANDSRPIVKKWSSYETTSAEQNWKSNLK